MADLRFDWDRGKNRANQTKHGVPFEEAQSAFYDEFARLKSDPDHSVAEERFILLGYSSRSRLLIVCQANRKNK